MNETTSNNWWRRLRLLRWFLVVCGLLLLVYVQRERILPAAARWLNVGEPPRKTDYVMVLGGDADVRPFVAAAIAKRGFASRVLVAPINFGPGEAPIGPTNEEIVGGVLKVRDVAAEKLVLLEPTSCSTFGEAVALNQFLDQRPDATVTVVTTNFHTRRSRWTFRTVLGKKKYPNVHFVAAPMDDFDESNWWRNRYGFQLYAMEYLKLVAYVFRYGNGLWWCLAASAMIVSLILCRWFIRRRSVGAKH